MDADVGEPRLGEVFAKRRLGKQPHLERAARSSVKAKPVERLQSTIGGRVVQDIPIILLREAVVEQIRKVFDRVSLGGKWHRKDKRSAGDQHAVQVSKGMFDGWGDVFEHVGTDHEGEAALVFRRSVLNVEARFLMIVSVGVGQTFCESHGVLVRIAHSDAGQAMGILGKFIDAKTASEQAKRQMMNHRPIAHARVARRAVRALALQVFNECPADRTANVAAENEGSRRQAMRERLKQPVNVRYGQTCESPSYP